MTTELERRLMDAFHDDAERARLVNPNAPAVYVGDSQNPPHMQHRGRRWGLLAAATITVLGLGLLAVTVFREPDSIQTDTVPPPPAPTSPATTSPAPATTTPLVVATSVVPEPTAPASTTESSSPATVPESVRNKPNTTFDQAARKVLDEMASTERRLGTSYQAARIVSIRYVPAHERVADGTLEGDEPTWTIESEGTTLGCGSRCTVSIGLVVRQYEADSGRYRAKAGPAATSVCQADTINPGPIPSGHPGSELPLCSDTPAPTLAATPGIPADEAGRIVLNLLETDLYTGYDDGRDYLPPWIVSVRLVPAGEPIHYVVPGDDAPRSDESIVSDVAVWAVEWDGTALKPVSSTSSSINLGGVMTVDVGTGEITASVYGPAICTSNVSDGCA